MQSKSKVKMRSTDIHLNFFVNPLIVASFNDTSAEEGAMTLFEV